MILEITATVAVLVAVILGYVWWRVEIVNIDRLVDTAVDRVRTNYLQGIGDPTEKQRKEAIRRVYHRVKSALEGHGIDIRSHKTEERLKYHIRKKLFDQ